MMKGIGVNGVAAHQKSRVACRHDLSARALLNALGDESRDDEEHHGGKKR